MASASPPAPGGGRVSIKSNPSAALATVGRNEHGDDGSPAWGGQGRRPGFAGPRSVGGLGGPSRAPHVKLASGASA